MQRNRSVVRVQREAARRRRNVEIPLGGFHVAIVLIVLFGVAAIAYGRAYRVSHVSDAPIGVSTTAVSESTTVVPVENTTTTADGSTEATSTTNR